MTPFLYELAGVKKSYQGKEVLALPYLVLSPERIYLVAGPNGAGKSTLLRILNLLEPPSQGTIKYDGQVIKQWQDLLPLRRQMAGVLQDPYLWDTSVFNNVAWGLAWRGYDRKESRQRVREALASLGLAGLEKRKASQLSLGEAKKVALARALAIRPRVLILDEPTAHVDEESVALVEKAISQLNQDCGTSVIMATHDPAQAGRLGDEVILLAEGRVLSLSGQVQIK